MTRVNTSRAACADRLASHLVPELLSADEAALVSRMLRRHVRHDVLLDVTDQLANAECRAQELDASGHGDVAELVRTDAEALVVEGARVAVQRALLDEDVSARTIPAFDFRRACAIGARLRDAESRLREMLAEFYAQTGCDERGRMLSDVQVVA